MATFGKCAIAVPLSTLVDNPNDSDEFDVVVVHVDGTEPSLAGVPLLCACFPAVFYGHLRHIFSHFSSTGLVDDVGFAVFVACESCCTDHNLAAVIFQHGFPPVYAYMSIGSDLDIIFSPADPATPTLLLPRREIFSDDSPAFPPEMPSYRLLWKALGAVFGEAGDLDVVYGCEEVPDPLSFVSDLSHPLVSSPQ